MKHLKPNTKTILAKADMKANGLVVIDPCIGLTGWDLQKCRKENPE